MGIYEFLMLSNEEQWDVLWDKGVYLTSFKSIDCSYRLYAIDKFYVELEMCTIHDTVLGMGVFVEGKKLEKYWEDGKLDLT
ncbi:MAG: hypothetical protein CMH46_08730 [Muricauda sp.]|nr:hypothetical protein [Allomuricauda sp.]MAU15608.1 hypothetical protein [Allomuricauda sp.]|tara:strand:- start:7878 stop:8120 length:243 start_codon:yes stop_codon:yes gene_type:complete